MSLGLQGSGLFIERMGLGVPSLGLKGLGLDGLGFLVSADKSGGPKAATLRQSAGKAGEKYLLRRVKTLTVHVRGHATAKEKSTSAIPWRSARQRQTGNESPKT